MSNEKLKEGTTPRSGARTFQTHRSGATMMQSHDEAGTSIPIQGSPSDSEERIDITGGSGIHVDDVLCGRGGNKRFREAITRSLEGYRKATSRSEKAAIVQRILDGVSNAGGRFLKKNESTGQWYQLSEQQTKEKVSHAVRDAANTIDAKKGQGGTSKLKAAKKKEGKLPAEPSHMASFASSGRLDSSNFYDNLDRATREIRRHASAQGESWYGLDQPSYLPIAEALGGNAPERLPIRPIRDLQIHSEGHSYPSAEIPNAQVGRLTQSMHNPVPRLERGGAWVHLGMNPSRQSIGGLLLHGARRPGSSIMLPDGPRVGLAHNQSNSIGATESSAPPQPLPVPRPIHQQHSSDEGDNFLARINDVLGPLPSDEHDPVARYLDRPHPRDG
eukprot:scaffold34607_cov177-Amphora_coffeaeformis.AAC.8